MLCFGTWGSPDAVFWLGWEPLGGAGLSLAVCRGGVLGTPCRVIGVREGGGGWVGGWVGLGATFCVWCSMTRVPSESRMLNEGRQGSAAARGHRDHATPALGLPRMEHLPLASSCLPPPLSPTGVPAPSLCPYTLARARPHADAPYVHVDHGIVEDLQVQGAHEAVQVRLCLRCQRNCDNLVGPQGTKRPYNRHPRRSGSSSGGRECWHHGRCSCRQESRKNGPHVDGNGVWKSLP